MELYVSYGIIPRIECKTYTDYKGHDFSKTALVQYKFVIKVRYPDLKGLKPRETSEITCKI